MKDLMWVWPLPAVLELPLVLFCFVLFLKESTFLGIASGVAQSGSFLGPRPGRRLEDARRERTTATISSGRVGRRR